MCVLGWGGTMLQWSGMRNSVRACLDSCTSTCGTNVLHYGTCLASHFQPRCLHMSLSRVTLFVVLVHMHLLGVVAMGSTHGLIRTCTPGLRAYMSFKFGASWDTCFSCYTKPEQQSYYYLVNVGGTGEQTYGLTFAELMSHP